METMKLIIAQYKKMGLINFILGSLVVALFIGIFLVKWFPDPIAIPQ